MKRKKPECPLCKDKSDVDSSLRCGTCGEQLEYADEDGTLRVAEKERKCPRCNTINSKDVKFCESCGAKIGKHCGYCKTYHFIEDKVCPKTGEPLKGEEEESEPGDVINRVLVAASILAILFFGFMIFRSSFSSNPPVAGSPSPAATLVSGSGPRIDVVFVVDATGSMGDEIEAVKSKIREMVRDIANGQPRPIVRYGLVAYRDRGDVFVTRKYKLTDSLNDVTSYINEVHADGGGDTPESVSEALHVAINELNWDQSANTRKMVFLIGDAGPHTDYQDDYDYREVARQAKKKGIKISAIGCSGITSSGESEFREIAQLSGGQFDFLTYQQVYTRSDGSEVRVLKAGEKAYMVTGGDKDEWKEGYSAMVREKKASEVNLSDIVPTAPYDGIGGGPAASASSKMKNNLDRMLTRQVQMEAEEMGVKYKK